MLQKLFSFFRCIHWSFECVKCGTLCIFPPNTIFLLWLQLLVWNFDHIVVLNVYVNATYVYVCKRTVGNRMKLVRTENWIPIQIRLKMFSIMKFHFVLHRMIFLDVYRFYRIFMLNSFQQIFNFLTRTFICSIEIMHE